MDILKREYILKHKDDNVIRFCPTTRQVKVINRQLLPMNISNYSDGYEMIVKFCSERILMMNRDFCKELLIACNIDDQSPVNICLVTNALSFIDNYWITLASHDIKWKDINLYHNEFTPDIARVGLTGELVNISSKIYTGELSSKGTRAKGVFRENGRLVLYKAQTMDEINSEIVSFYIARALGLDASQYMYARKYDRHCSCCILETDTDKELLPCRDIMTFYRENKSSIESQTYKYFMTVDKHRFLLLQIFDYLTLNVDRNRDNYGIFVKDGIPLSLYPLFDHDSCFKAKTTRVNSFVMGTTFEQGIRRIQPYFDLEIYHVLKSVRDYFHSQQFADVFLQFKDKEEYKGLLSRIDKLANGIG